MTSNRLEGFYRLVTSHLWRFSQKTKFRVLLLVSINVEYNKGNRIREVVSSEDTIRDNRIILIWHVTDLKIYTDWLRHSYEVFLEKKIKSSITSK